MSVVASQLIAKVGTQGVEESKGQLKSMGQAVSETSSGFKSMLGNALSFAASQAIFNAVGSAVGFLKNQVTDSIQAAIQHQDIMEQTAKVLKSTGDASGMTQQSLEALAGSLEKTTYFSKDTTETGENMLLTFTNIGKDVFPLATKTMLDMSKAMGGDVKNTAIMMGKALDDPATGLTALTRVGVTFSTQQQEMIKHMVAVGDTAGAQKIMLQELQREFGGSADATTTAAGRMQIFKDRVGDLKERIGTALLPVLGGLMDHLASPALDAAEGLFYNLGGAVSYVGDILRTVHAQDFSDALQSVKSTVRDLAGDFGRFAASLHPVSTDFDPLADKIQGLAQGAIQLLTSGLNNVYVALSGVDGAFHGGKGPVEDFLNSVKSLVDPLKTVAQSALSLIGPAFSLYSAISPLHLVFAEAGNIISQILPPALGIAQQVFGGLKDIIASLTPVVSGQLVPAIKGLADAIIPIVAHILEWIDKSGIVKIALGAVKDVVVPLVSILSGLINGLTSVVKFFTQTQFGADLLKAALIALAVPLGILAAVVIPPIIAGLIAMAVNAVITGATMVLAFAPIVLPILAVVAAIAGLIFAIQHWGDISKFLQGVWASFSSWFMGIMHDIGEFFVNVWHGIVSGLQAAWGVIINVVKIGALALLAIIFAPIVAIAALFIWLYGHNRYFQMLIDDIVKIVKMGVAWLQAAWSDSINWIVGAWGNLVKFASDLWGQVSGAIQFGFSAAIGFVASIWADIASFFSNAWNNYIVKPLTDLWTNVSNFFSNVWDNYIVKPVEDLWNSLTTAIGGWADKAIDWGKNLIKSFVNGIVGEANSVAGAVGGIAQKVLEFLGFHSPTKEGPGKEADQWAPNFIKMYVAGLQAGIPQIEDTVSKLVKPVSVGINPSIGSVPYLPQGAQIFPASQTQQMLSGSKQPVTIVLQVGSRQMARVFLPDLVNEIRNATGARI